MNMKLSDYLLFTALLIPTLVVLALAVITLASPDPGPEYHPPVLGVDVLGKPVVR